MQEKKHVIQKMQRYFTEALESETTEAGEEAIFEKKMRFSRNEKVMRSQN